MRRQFEHRARLVVYLEAADLTRLTAKAAGRSVVDYTRALLLEHLNETGEPETLRRDRVVPMAQRSAASAPRPGEPAGIIETSGFAAAVEEAEPEAVTRATSNEPEEEAVGTGHGKVPPLAAPATNLREMPPQPKPLRSYKKQARPEKQKFSKPAGKWHDMEVCRHGIAVGACKTCDGLDS